MTPTDCVRLVKFINARCPAMRLDEATPDAWYLDLADLDINDALAAARAISARQAFVNLHELLTETASIQRTRQGRERVEQLEAQIAAENPPLPLHARPVAALEVGQTPPSVRMRTEVNLRRKPAAAIDTEAVAAEQAAREQARREVAEHPNRTRATDAALATPDHATEAVDA